MDKIQVANAAAKVAYTSYSAHTDNKSLVTGASLPTWDELPDDIKVAWRVSTKSAILYFIQEGMLV